MTVKELEIQIALGTLTIDFFRNYHLFCTIVNEIDSPKLLQTLFKELQKYAPLKFEGTAAFEYCRRRSFIYQRLDNL